MTRPTTTGKAQDLITFTRSTTGTALAKISYGEELVTNGDFSNGTTGWSGDGATILSAADNKLLVTNGDNTPAYAVQYIDTVIGERYTFTADLISTSGSLARMLVSGGVIDTGATLSAGAQTITWTATLTSHAIFVANGANVSTGDVVKWSNISVKEVLYDRPDGTLQLFNHPINKPRIEYDAEGNCLGLLVEEARTNLLTYSETFTPQWTTQRLSSQQNATISPTGENNAVKLIPNTDNSNHYLYQTYSAGTHTWSVYAKAGEYGRISLWEGGVTAKYTSFDLVNGTKLQGNADSDSITPVGNGWYRLTMTITVSSGTPYFLLAALNNEVISHSVSFSGDGVSGIYIWGAQLETGSFPTSYIPTSGSAVTRSADVASLAVSEFGYNQGQGTVFINCLITEQPDFNLRVIDGNSNTKRWMYVNAPDNDYGLKYYDGTNNPTLVSSGIPLNMKAAVAVTPTQVFGAANSSAVGSGAHNGTLLDISQFNFFSTLNGHIKSVQYYPLRLSNAQLQALTV